MALYRAEVLQNYVFVILCTILIAACNCAKNGSLLEASENVNDKGQVEGAGYDGFKMENFSKDRIVTFCQKVKEIFRTS